MNTYLVSDQINGDGLYTLSEINYKLFNNLL